jgi:protein TonB
MLNHLLDPERSRRAESRALMSLSVSLSAHALAFSALLLGAFFAVSPIRMPSLHNLDVERLILTPKLPPAVAAAAAPKGVERPRPAKKPAVPETKPADVHEVIQPEVRPVPEAPPADSMEDDEIYEEGLPEGLDGGVPGGVAEGQLGGEVGGDPNGVVGGVRGGVRHGDGDSVIPAPEEPVHLMGDIRPPERVFYVTPAYPESARAARMEGTVVLEIVVGRDGAVEKVTPISGNVIFRQVAVDAVAQWHYKPVLQNGTPVKVYVTVRVHFSLH